jgi:hypothetical protein
MVLKCRDSNRHCNLVCINGETCYVLLTDHYNGHLFGRAFAMKAPADDWLNNWLANNAPQYPNKYVRMNGGGELGKCREIHRTFPNFGYSVEFNRFGFLISERPRGTSASDHRRRPACYALRQPPTAFLALRFLPLPSPVQLCPAWKPPFQPL